MATENAFPSTLLKAVKFFSNPTACREFLADLRWVKGPVCPKCDSDCITLLETRNIYKCRTCKKQFSIKVGTIFEDSPIPLEKWLPAAWLIINCKNGVSSYEIARDLGVTQKTAWFMLHRIRLAMRCGTFEKLSGVVEADETYIGGKAVNMHPFKVAQLKARGLNRLGTEGKTIIAGLLERHPGKHRVSEARVKVMPNVRAYHIRRNVIDNVDKGATVYTDSLRSYRNLPVDGFVHEFIDHTEAYVRDAVHTNGMENFWSLFKRALKGTYVSVEPFHLQAYADEQCFRFNQRDLDDFARFVMVMRQIIGRRLTWNQLLGRDEVPESQE